MDYTLSRNDTQKDNLLEKNLCIYNTKKKFLNIMML